MIFANLLTFILLHRLDVPYRLQWFAGVAAAGGTALLAVLTGWLASIRILGQRPLEVLREGVAVPIRGARWSISPAIIAAIVRRRRGPDCDPRAPISAP